MKKTAAFLFILTWLLVACQSAAPQVDLSNIQVTVAPQATFVFETPTPGKIAVSGTLLVTSPDNLLPASDDAIFLVPLDETVAGAMTIPSFAIGEVPQADVDETNGTFLFPSIEPGRYALVVVTVSGSQIPARTYGENATLAIFTFTAEQQDTVVELGLLTFP
jgi:hypothetical protein